MGSSLYSQHGQEASPRYRSLPHAACSSRPVTGQADRGIPQPSGFFDGEDMLRKRLEGRSSEGEWRAHNSASARHERKSGPSSVRPDAAHWQRVAASNRRAGVSGGPENQ
ncbi:hypothetical protein MU249_004378 [Salmonella enterica]|nr:hypothetical protein [Salmonella enterica]EEE5613441.1 hypothetical protein [Salmonella enterica subsp. enterica serovar Typhimurium]EEF7432168.1 hypothetical protein [Salmonella enterica subsp. enterica serovar Java]EGL0768326.1 hypothetical protein [Salmonella enterica subsp. enterica]HCM8913520.1 hypothetical protein [Salmonella enterica subsp. enterica serovar Paratyphi B]